MRPIIARAAKRSSRSERSRRPKIAFGEAKTLRARKKLRRYGSKRSEWMYG